jgi:hypothetical protein
MACVYQPRCLAFVRIAHSFDKSTNSATQALASLPPPRTHAGCNRPAYHLAAGFRLRRRSLCSSVKSYSSAEPHLQTRLTSSCIYPPAISPFCSGLLIDVLMPLSRNELLIIVNQHVIIPTPKTFTHHHSRANLGRDL